jgi:Mg2+ and Co2+ transporter CorA
MTAQVDSVQVDMAVAKQIAERIRTRSGRRGGWLEVRALMGEFDIERLSDEARQRMTSALREVGVTVSPPLAEVDRRDTLILSSTDGSFAPASQGADRSLDEVVTVRIADSTGTVRRVGLHELSDMASTQGVRWFDVRDSTHVSAADLFDYLTPFGQGQITRDMVDDLLSPDPRPKIEKYPDSPVHCVSAFKVSACESDEGADPASASKAGVLVFEPVEFLVGTGWVVTCWHDIEVYREAKRIRESRPSPPDALFEEVERCWSRELSTAGDLAVLVLHELTLSYAPAYRQLYVWEEEWELDFYRRPERTDRETLMEARAAAAILRDWLSPLNPAGMREDISRAWFPEISGTAQSGGYERALRADARIDSALVGVRMFNETLRSAYDLLQLREGELERERDDRFQRNVAVGGSVILIPTLVAGVMGANTWVPGQFQGTGRPPHWAFLALLAIILLSGVLAWGAIRWLQAKDNRDGRGRGGSAARGATTGQPAADQPGIARLR